MYTLIRADQVHKSTPSGYYFVTYVVDGDTIEVDMNGVREKVRLIGVDTPETHHPTKPVQCFGLKAADYTKTHVEHVNVRLESDPINQNRDRYQRLLRYVYLEDGTLWNAKLIEDGYGHALTAFPFTKVDEFTKLETEARVQSRGLWNECQT
jgi:micrococcal nuclease